MKRWQLYLVLFLLLFLLAGCTWLDNLQAWKNGENLPSQTEDNSSSAQESTSQEQAAEKTAPKINDLQDNLAIKQNNAYQTEKNTATKINYDTNQPNQVQVGGETKEIILYFADKSGKYLQEEKRQIAKEQGIAKAVLNELLKGPENSQLKAVIPPATKVNSLNIKGDLCIVDFTSALTDTEGSFLGDKLAIYSIVNTLTAFDNIEKVQFLFNGHKKVKSAGGIDLQEALSANYDLMKP
ncbi:MAG: GerMN domain-containing protein [Clostridiales bacterium]